MCFNPIICIYLGASVCEYLHLIINQAMVILTKDQRIVLAWVKFLIISYIISIAYIIQYTSYQLYHISQYTKDSTCLGVVPNHILYHTNFLHYTTYQIYYISHYVKGSTCLGVVPPITRRPVGLAARGEVRVLAVPEHQKNIT